MGCIDSSIGMVMAVWVKKTSAYASSSVVCDQPERFFLHIRVPVKLLLETESSETEGNIRWMGVVREIEAGP